MKITIVGPSSSGKSTLAKRISQRFTIPRLELDRLWFEAGGHDCFVNGCTEEEKNKISLQIKDQVEDFLTQHKDWVIDGTYTKIQPMIADQADNVVLIQRQLVKRIISHIVRVVKNEGRHPETTRWQDLCFTKTLVKRWLKNEQRDLQKFLSNYTDKVIVLKSFKDIDHYFNFINK